VLRYDTRCYFKVHSKADISQLNLPHGKKGTSQSGRGHLGVDHSTIEMHWTMQAANAHSSTGLQTCLQGQDITTKAWLQNGLTHHRGNKCGTMQPFMKIF